MTYACSGREGKLVETAFYSAVRMDETMPTPSPSLTPVSGLAIPSKRMSLDGCIM